MDDRTATRLVIVGGVAGGATAAARARRLDENAEITVLERGPYISFANCGLPYHVGEEIRERESLLLQTPEALRARYNIDVRVRHEVLRIDRGAKELVVKNLAKGAEYRLPYDRLILSPGAAPLRPPLTGIDHPQIHTMRTVPDTDRIKAAVDGGAGSAIVVGGGFIGLEMVENLRRRGLTVHLVEMLDQVMPPLDPEMASAIHDQLRLEGVDLRLGDAVDSFADEGGQVAATLKSGTRLVADLVVLAIGVRPENVLAKEAGLEVAERGGIVVDDHQRTSDPEIFAVGDAVQVTDYVTGGPTMIPLAGPANRQGRIAADNALGRDSAYRGSQGTSVLGIFGLTVAMTGASEKTLKRSGRNYEKVYLHPAQHVGYYPGSAQMSIKLLFDPQDGRVLGAQIVGCDGVDKRIDVLATAIQARMTVFDLEEVELAYAPQYGAAKDPINMAGFVAANVIRGDASVVHADALDGHLVLDVRNPDEVPAGVIPGATVIPLPELRQRMQELPKDRPIAAYCQVGMRGYLAARMLEQHGYTAHNISGGYRTWKAFHPALMVEGDGSTQQGGAAMGACPGDGYSAQTKAKTSGGAAASCCGGSAAPAGTVDAAGRTTDQAGGAPQTDMKLDMKPDMKLDVSGKCCPGPIVALADTMKTLPTGRVVEVVATDPGFVMDIPAWCRNTGNELLASNRQNGSFHALVRKGSHGANGADAAPGVATSAATAAAPATRNKTMVVFSGELDRVMAALIIANGAASMGQKVTLFFTFWGLNALRADNPPAVKKSFMESMFGWMMPRGAARLPLSKMHMGGMGKRMMLGVMRSKNVDSITELLAQAQRQGVELVACAMSMDVMGIKAEELIDGVQVGGVAAYLAEADQANANLFI